jgi:putative spermidine/putrescine transport system permease protein
MLPRWVTVAYLAYLVAPILLLLVGSFGGLWLNTLLPTGFTGRWYLEVAADPSFRRAFNASLFVAAATGAPAWRSAALARGVPAQEPAVRTGQDCISCRSRCPLIIARLHLLFSSDTLPWLGSIWPSSPATRCSACVLPASVVTDGQRLGLATLEDAADSLGSRRSSGSHRCRAAPRSSPG